MSGGTLKTTNIQHPSSNSGPALSLAANNTAYFTSKVYDNLGDIRGSIPQVQQTTTYTLANTDSGLCISTNSDVTVPAGVLLIGQAVSIFNNSSSNISVKSDGVSTLYYAGTSNTTNKILFQRGLATVVCVFANTFVVTGSGLI